MFRGLWWGARDDKTKPSVTTSYFASGRGFDDYDTFERWPQEYTPLFATEKEYANFLWKRWNARVEKIQRHKPSKPLPKNFIFSTYDYDKDELVLGTPYTREMERRQYYIEHSIPVTVTWMFVAKKFGLCRDVARMIGKMVRNAKMISLGKK